MSHYVPCYTIIVNSVNFLSAHRKAPRYIREPCVKSVGLSVSESLSVSWDTSPNDFPLRGPRYAVQFYFRNAWLVW